MLIRKTAWLNGFEYRLVTQIHSKQKTHKMLWNRNKLSMANGNYQQRERHKRIDKMCVFMINDWTSTNAVKCIKMFCFEWKNFMFILKFIAFQFRFALDIINFHFIFGRETSLTCVCVFGWLSWNLKPFIINYLNSRSLTFCCKSETLQYARERNFQSRNKKKLLNFNVLYVSLDVVTIRLRIASGTSPFNTIRIT